MTGKTFNVYDLRPEDITPTNIVLLAMTSPLVKLDGEGDKLFRMYINQGRIAFIHPEDNEPFWQESRYFPDEYGKYFKIVEIIHDDND